jgi:transposase
MTGINLQDVGNTIIRDDETVNSESVVRFLCAIREHYPIEIAAHVLLDGAGYHRSQ